MKYCEYDNGRNSGAELCILLESANLNHALSLVTGKPFGKVNLMYLYFFR